MVLPGPLPRRPCIRFMAATDDTAIGLVGLGYLTSLLRVAPVRIASVTGGLCGGWERFAPLLSTPMTSHYVNVVCCRPDRWTWMHTVQMPNRDGTFTPAADRRELYTHGVRNVLLTDHTPPRPGLAELAIAGDRLAEYARKYEAIVVPTLELGAAWSAFGCHPHVVPVPVRDHSAIRELIMPT